MEIIVVGVLTVIAVAFVLIRRKLKSDASTRTGGGGGLSRDQDKKAN